MDRWLQESVTRGDVFSLRNRIEQDETIVRQTVPGSLNTILHLCARFGHLEYAKEVLNRCPDVASMENADLETPLHEACRQGHLEIVKLILETLPSIVYKVNSRMQSAFFAACEKGKIDVVKHLLIMNSPQLLMLEVDMDTNSLHVAASSGFTEIVKEILKACPDLAWKKNSHGCTPLHLSCSKGHLQITREFLQLDSDLCLVHDIQGRTPLHWAVIRGRMNVIDEILSSNLEFTEMKTHNGESILHLGVKNNQYDVVKYLTETLNMSRLLNLQDSDGNTVLHLATAGKLTAMLMHLLKIGVEVNTLNGKGYTALDVIEADASHSGLLAIVPSLQEAGAKRCDQLSPGLIDIQQVAESANADVRTSHHKSMSWRDKTQEYRSPRHHHHRPSRQRRKKLNLQNEGVRNARKTITIVAVLIATVTFSAGINPPGGFNQQTGIAVRGNRTGFKVFLACNIVALFLSIGVVNVLVSIIPFTRKNMMQLLTVTHKIMWVSSIFMIAAYIAAVWTTTPNEREAKWLFVELILFGGGSTVVVFLGLGFLLARHWHNKYKWRLKQERMNDGSPKSNTSRVEELKSMKNGMYSSSNSDVDSSDQGYHLY